MLNTGLLHDIDAYWRAVNHLSVGQPYLYDNPLLRRPLMSSDVKQPVVVDHRLASGHNTPLCPPESARERIAGDRNVHQDHAFTVQPARRRRRRAQDATSR
ncbi:phosphoketolase family protein [Mycolicibacterium fluoranthenivorans]|uniref:hypothetical protein n=1 Tax=Mycolicibacterium fluoranthenivorans TaxID=258505 RepID=UPI00142357EE|nr:hypothetical protein [Mycolicibacterium fluoranthenivorans]